jgi:hypothetical protein
MTPERNANGDTHPWEQKRRPPSSNWGLIKSRAKSAQVEWDSSFVVWIPTRTRGCDKDLAGKV